MFAAQRQMSLFKQLCPTGGENGTVIFCFGDAGDEHVEKLGRRMAAGRFSSVTSLQLVSYFCFDADMNVWINAPEAGMLQFWRPGRMRIGRSAEMSQQAAGFAFGESQFCYHFSVVVCADTSMGCSIRVMMGAMMAFSHWEMD